MQCSSRGNNALDAAAACHDSGRTGHVDTTSHETVRQVLLANKLKPWIKQQWCIPSRADAEFVYHMEDVLSVYTRPYAQAHPQVCMDEINTQLLSESRQPLEMEPGHPKREDYEYVREGVCNVFLACEPLTGQRYTMVAAQRTKREWAQFIRHISDEYYPQANKIVLVMDNLIIPWRRSTKCFPLLRHAGCVNALRCITPLSMAVGSTWPKLNSRRWIDNASRNG